MTRSKHIADIAITAIRLAEALYPVAKEIAAHDYYDDPTWNPDAHIHPVTLTVAEARKILAVMGMTMHNEDVP